MARSEKTAGGKELFNAAWGALKQDKEMLWLPVLGGIASAVATAVFFGFVLALGGFSNTTHIDANGSTSSSGSVWLWVFGVLLVWVSTVIAVYCNTALVAGASLRMDGGDPSLGYCFSQANSRIPQILGWATLTAIVSVVLRAIAERLGPVGAVVIALIGGGWEIVTYFAVPVLLEEGTGPFGSVKRSKEVLFSSFGKVVRTNIRYGLKFLVYFLGVFLLAVAGVFLMAQVSFALGIAVLVLAVLCFMVLVLVINALSMYVRTSLYRYAVGKPVPGVPQEAFAGAFSLTK